jgi:hypothetical protein
VRVNCPHCRTACLVAEQHLGVPLQCGRCRRTFTTRADAAPLVRLDIGAAASPDKADSFLVQRLSWCNLDQWHEWAVLALADGLEGAARASLLSKIVNGTAKDVAGVSEAVIAALPGANVAVVIGDGQAHIRHAGDGRVYHQRTGRLAQVTRDRTALSSLKLAAGDWLLVIRNGPDATALQAEIAQTPSSAVQLAQQLIERGGNSTVVAVRCY